MDKGRPVSLRVRARPAAAREPPRPPAAHTPWAKWESQASEAPPRPQRPVLLGFPAPHCSMLLNTIQSTKPSSVVRSGTTCNRVR
jgi:hypothetical protein